VTESIRNGAALWGGRGDLVEVAGADRVRFLHNLTTCDVAGLGVGGSIRGFVVDVQGRVLADADVVALEDRLRLRLPAGRAEAIAAHLLKYRIAERVEIEARPERAIAELRGRRAPELLATLGVAAPAVRGGHLEVELGGVAVRLRSLPRAREPRFELVADGAELPKALGALKAAGGVVGLVEPSAVELEAARIEDGELAWGIDYDASNFPQETGELEAISTTKGCYLGQEVIARIHFRGQVQRQARGLTFEPGAAVAAGEELSFEGRPAARVTSVAESALLGRPVGLALVHRRAAEPGTRLTRASGAAAGEAEVVALPFELPPFD
jgi:folate-binding protein YgfZ